MGRNNHDISEEKLKELQRKEALSDSDEYDIQDNTYDRAPLTRQYVKDDVVVKGSQFVDDDDDDVLIVNAPVNKPVLETEDEDEDIIVIAKPPVVTPPPVEESIDDKYTKKSEPVVETPKAEPKPKEEVPVEKPKKQDPAKNLPAKMKLKEPNESDRDYIDRENTIHYNGIAEFERIKKEKPAKEKKQANLSWLKPVIAAVAIILSVILAIFLFGLIRDYQAAAQEPDAVKLEYVEFVELTNKTLTYENSNCKDFKNVTEQFVIDAISKEVFIQKLTEIRTNLSSEMTNYSLKTYDHIDVYDIKTLSVDYLKTAINTIDKILAEKDSDVITLKTIILSDVNDVMATREQQFNNIVSLINDTSAKYDIESELQEGTVYFNVNIEK